MSNRKYIEAKIRRIADGGRVRVLDLFGGCGGLSLGFRSAGFQIVGHVEMDECASRSFGRNFFADSPPEIRDAHSKARDITKTEPEQLVSELKLDKSVPAAVDVIIGGPPCQAFARVGRAKLREVAEHPTAFKLDPRANLYLRFLHYVEAFRPLAILMENVPDVINFGGHNIPEETCEVLEEKGYIPRYTLLNSAFYGVPQMRERMFLIAFAKEFHSPVCFPRPTHWIQLPKGYEGTRSVALKNLQEDLFSNDSFYIPPPVPSPELKPAVSARQALHDLPPITEHLEGKMKRGARRFDQRVEYRKNGAMSEYLKRMRRWKGLEANGGVFDHVIRSLPRDYAIFKRMKAGDQYPEAHHLALRMLDERVAELRANHIRIESDSPEFEKLKKQTVPMYDPTKFPNKWRKMEPDLPARTLMAHLGKDSYSHIHYDSNQARTISVREAARLQSFPDGFFFEGTMNPAFRQIGNAVPPLLAAAIAKQMMRTIKHEKKTLR